jgi:hypothetical protein
MSGMMIGAAAVAGGLDPDAAAFIARFTVDPDYIRKNAINQLFLSLKNSGIYNKLDSLYIAKKSQDTQSALLDWKRPTKSATLNGGITVDSSLGFNGNGVGYVDINFTPSVDGVKFTTNKAGLGCIVTKYGSSGNALFGSFEELPQDNRIACFTDFYHNGVSYQIIAINGGTTPETTMTFTLADPTGFLQLNRETFNSAYTFMNGVQVAASSDALVRKLSSNPILLLGEYRGSLGPQYMSDCSIGAFYLGDSLLTEDQHTLQEILETYFDTASTG